MYFGDNKKNFNRYGLDLEITNHCNANCIICDRKTIIKGGLGFMSKETYEIVLKKGIKFLRIISFGGIGDCFLHKDFHNFLDILIKYIDKNDRKSDLNIFIYTKLQNITEDDFVKIKNMQNLGYKIFLYVSIFSFRRKEFEFMTGIKFDLFMKNFKLLNKMKINYKINFTLTKYNVDDLPILIKNFNNYQIETVHNFMGSIDDYKPDMMKNIEIFSRNTLVTEENSFKSFSIIYNGDFRLSDEDSTRKIKVGNIKEISFYEANDILNKLEGN